MLRDYPLRGLVRASTNATLWRDGQHRVTLRITTHLDHDAVAAAIAMGSYEDADTIASAGRRQLLEWARAGVQSYGMGYIRTAPIADYAPEVAAAKQRLVVFGVFPGAVAGSTAAHRTNGE